MINLPQNFLLINKPANWTSFDAIGFIRKKMIAGGAPKNLKVGHSGTLDPFATGLLIVGIGREATKRLDKFKNLPKTYVAEICLGATSDTGDSTGVIMPTPNCHPELVSGSASYDIRLENEGMLKQVQHDKKTITAALQTFLGPQLQIPPMYSAKKIAGKKLYELARAGKTVERQPTPIEIYDIKLLDYAWPNLKVEVTCSAGTYIRTLAEDIGAKLGTGAYCHNLTRTKIGEYSLADALAPSELALNPL